MLGAPAHKPRDLYRIYRVFIGHFGVGFAAKPLAPRVSLGTLFLAAQFIDLLWPSLLLLGVEHVRIIPGTTVVTPLVFDYYPYSHSLLFVIVWALAIGGMHFLRHQNRNSALVIGALVVSHWVLDVIVHTPDLPLIPRTGPLLGFGAWNSLPLTLAIELPLFIVGVWLYARHTKPADATGKWALYALIALLLLIYAGNLFGEAPPSIKALAWVGQLQWLLVVMGYWVDRHRVVDAT